MHYARTVADEVTYEHPNPHPHPHPRRHPDQVKSEHPGATSYEVKAIISQRWRALAEGSVPSYSRYVTHLAFITSHILELKRHCFHNNPNPNLTLTLTLTLTLALSLTLALAL